MPESLENIFGAVLKKMRSEMGISQEKLALDSELDRTFISMMERGERQPSITTLFKLAGCLNKKPSEIIKLVEAEYENK